jgi:uncharacterized cupredoxin-like copper-binding protein
MPVQPSERRSRPQVTTWATRRRPFVVAIALMTFSLLGSSGAAQERSPTAATCDAPALPSTAQPSSQPIASPAASSDSAGRDVLDAEGAPLADPATSARIIGGIENFVACRNAGDYAGYAALLTPNRMLAEAGTTNPRDVVASLEDFNLPITILALGDVRTYPDGRASAEFVHLFGPHLYYRSRIYVVEEGAFVKFDEERFLPEEPTGERSVVDVQLTDFAFTVSPEIVENAPYIVLHGTNAGRYPHEIIVARLPVGATVAQALAGEVPEEQIEFIGQTLIAPGQVDDLVLVNLDSGAYALLCLIDEPDGIPHAARGMAAEVTIEGTTALGLKPTTTQRHA